MTESIASQGLYTSVSQLSAIGGGNPDFQNGNGHPASIDLWLTLYASDADAILTEMAGMKKMLPERHIGIHTRT